MSKRVVRLPGPRPAFEFVSHGRRGPSPHKFSPAIDKAMLRDWREQFAELMREQGIAANATRRAVRGKNPRKGPRGLFAAREHGNSSLDRLRVAGIVRDLRDDPRALADPKRRLLLETRKALIDGWTEVVNRLVNQGERDLAREVRVFMEHLPTVATDRQKLALRFVRFDQQRQATERDEMQRNAQEAASMERGRGREEGLTR